MSRLIHEREGEVFDFNSTSSKLSGSNWQGGESRLRHAVWGGMILLVGALTMFGYWFLFVG